MGGGVLPAPPNRASVPAIRRRLSSALIDAVSFMMVLKFGHSTPSTPKARRLFISTESKAPEMACNRSSGVVKAARQFPSSISRSACGDCSTERMWVIAWPYALRGSGSSPGPAGATGTARDSSCWVGIDEWVRIVENITKTISPDFVGKVSCVGVELYEPCCYVIIFGNPKYCFRER